MSSKPELKVENDVFYLLDANGEKWLYATEQDAIASLKDVIAKDKELSPETVSIVEVNTVKETWEMKAVPWAKIAIELIRGAKTNE